MIGNADATVTTHHAALLPASSAPARMAASDCSRPSVATIMGDDSVAVNLICVFSLMGRQHDHDAKHFRPIIALAFAWLAADEGTTSAADLCPGGVTRG